MRSILSGLLMLAAFLTLPADAQSDVVAVDRLVERYIDAIGGRPALAALQNLVYRDGIYEEADYRSDGDATMSLARPYFKRVGTPESGYMEGYDGAAWEWFGDPGVVVRTVGAASAAIRHYAGVEHPLVNWRAKGSVVSLEGETLLDGKTVSVIRLIRRDGYVEQFYLAAGSGLIAASGGAAPIHAFGDAVSTLTRISDYRPVEGVRIAHRFETIEVPSGKAVSAMQWDRIDGNVDLPDGWFSPPVFERTPVQRFIENLFIQRSDLLAVMWTYHEFRRAYPGVDTSEAVNVAGFQTLKMGQTDQAVALLEQNVQDYPVSANARYGLARAYRTTGRREDAAAQFRAALKLDPGHRRSRKALQEMESAADTGR